MIKAHFTVGTILTTFSHVLDTDTSDYTEIRRLLNEVVAKELGDPKIKVREIFFIEGVSE